MKRIAFLIAIFILSVARAEQTEKVSFFVNQVRGDDSSNGSAASPFKTVARALREVDGKGGVINLDPEGGYYTQPIVIRKGGQPNCPLVIDGHGAVINLGIDVTKGPWTDTGNGFLLERAVVPNTRLWIATVAFVNGIPVSCDAPKGSGAWHDQPRDSHQGFARYDDEKRLILTFPAGLDPANSVIVLPGGGADFASGIQINGASHIRIRNITAAFTSNDGFNFHGDCRDIEMENVKGLFNGDQGTSAHETCEVTVRNSEFAFNGSGDGAVEDIQNSVTSYYHVLVHHNRNKGFSFPVKQGDDGRHILEKVTSYGNGKNNLPPPSDTVILRDCQDLGYSQLEKNIPIVANQAAASIQESSVSNDDQLGRFLRLRP